MSFFGSRRQPEPEPQSPPERERPPQPPQREQPTAAPPPQPVGFETVLGTNCSMEGKLVSNANVRLDGTFSGTLEISGNVLIGETAKINADVNAKNISIAGAVRGNVTGKKVQLLRTGRVWGDINAKALTTEEGAFIDGKISMMAHDAAHPDTPADEPIIAETPLPTEPEFLADMDNADASDANEDTTPEDDSKLFS